MNLNHRSWLLKKEGDNQSKIQGKIIKYVTLTLAVGIVMAALHTNTAYANLYPIAPPNTFVSLDHADFIQIVPEQSPGLLDPNSVTGDNLGQHPGAFKIGHPDAGTFFIGVFGDLIDTSKPDNAVYLWETTSKFNPFAFSGPQIQLGYWDWAVMSFTPYGNPQTASYLGTGVLAIDPFYEISSSITPLSDFGITPALPFSLNAVRIEAVDGSHNQVTAVATHLVPEPATGLLLATGFVGLLGYGWQRGKRRKT